MLDSGSNPTPTWWTRGGWFLPAFVAVIILRFRFLTSPITSDEGGYFGAARAWARGATLYEDVWVDRPQGLLLLYRLLHHLGLGNPVGIRLLALVVCLIGAAGCGYAARRLFGPGAAWPAALAAGVFSSLPHAEGFIANSELLSCGFSALGLALLLHGYWERERPLHWALAAGGFFGAFAITVKQSGFDAFFAGVFMLVIVCLGRRWPVRQRIAAIASAVAGFAVPMILMVIHAAATGWSRWWYAFAGYRTDQRSALRNADWRNLLESGGAVGPSLLPGLIIILAVAIRYLRRDERRAAALMVVWMVFALLAFLLGGQFFRHYWVIFMFPIGAAVGAAVSLVPAGRMRHLLLAAALVVPVGYTIRAMALSEERMGPVLSGDLRLVRTENVARWFRDNREPDENIYAMCASAALYANVPTDPPYPYLWFALIPQVPGAHDQLIELFEGDDAPTYVARFQSAQLCDPSGVIGRSLLRRYRTIGNIDGMVIYARSDRALADDELG